MLTAKKFAPLLLVVFFSTVCYSQNADIDILRKLNKNETAFKNFYLKGAASSVSWFAIAAPAGIFAAGLQKHDKRLQKEAMYMAGSYLFTALVTQGMKKIIDRKRPFETLPFIIKRDNVDPGHSMPSGHTSSAFGLATALSLNHPKWYVIVPSYIWASSVAWARMYQGVHYPGDVIVGAIVGAGSSWIGHKVQQLLENKQEASKAATAKF